MKSNEILYSKGKNDECFTPAYAVEPILKYIPKKAIVWCPFDKKHSEFVKMIEKQNQVMYSHIEDGRDFFEYEPKYKWDMIISNPPFCFDKKTEILTKTGWKNVRSVTVNEQCLTLSLDNKRLEYSDVIVVTTQYYTGDMYRIKSKYIDLNITPNHRMVAYNKDGKILKEEGDLYPIKKLPKYNAYLPLDGYSFCGEDKECFVIPSYTHSIRLKNNKSREKHYPEIKIKIEAWLAFFGFWLADGFVSGSNGGRNKLSVGLKQHKDRHNDVCLILDNLGLNYKYYFNKNNTVNYDINSAQFNYYMSKFGNSREKYIPKELLNLPTEKLKILFDSYVFGDCTSYSDGGGQLSTVSQQLANDLTELSLKTGKILSMKKKTILYKNKPYIIYRGCLIKDSSKNKKCKINSEKISIHNHNGFVYGIEVQINKTLVVRRNGVVFITGNSNKRKFFERALSFGKPFALIMSNTWLNDSAPIKIFMEKDLQLLMFTKRIEYINENGKNMGRPTFSSSYYCWSLLPKQIIMESLNMSYNPTQTKLFNK